MKEEHIGFFGGSFDPIHFGHIHLALQMLELHKLDRVLFCPAFLSPFRGDEPPRATPKQRLEMTALAIKPIEKFSLLDVEVKREETSYTIDTIRSLKKDAENRGKKCHFHLILGEDSLLRLADWKEIKDLLLLAPPLVGSRMPQALSIPESLKPLIQKGITKIPVMEISSTEIRERIKKRLYCGHLVPAKVLDYIYENLLYYL